jgi:hypothetical protein
MPVLRVSFSCNLFSASLITGSILVFRLDLAETIEPLDEVAAELRGDDFSFGIVIRFIR